MAEFKISRGLQENFDAIQTKDGDTIYVCTDTGFCYLGDRLLSPRASSIFASGIKVYYDGVEVTTSRDLPKIIERAKSNWYGTESSYNLLVQNNLIQTGTLYHLIPQADYNESDPNKLGYIKNMPRVMDLRIEDMAAVFFYR